MKGAVVEEVVLADNLTRKQAYKLEYRYLKKMVHDGKRLQLWNIIPPSDLHATGAREVCEETHRKHYKQRSLDPNFCSHAAN